MAMARTLLPCHDRAQCLSQVTWGDHSSCPEATAGAFLPGRDWSQCVDLGENVTATATQSDPHSKHPFTASVDGTLAACQALL